MRFLYTKLFHTHLTRRKTERENLAGERERRKWRKKANSGAGSPGVDNGGAQSRPTASARCTLRGVL